MSNRPALWKTMLGAVTVPASVLLTPADVGERLTIAGARFWIADADLAKRFGDVGKDVIRIAAGLAPQGWLAFDELRRSPAEFTPDAETDADDPILLYFTSGTTSKPKLVMHSHRSYGIGSLSAMYWLGLTPDDIHLNVSSPGWAKHAWSCLFAP